MMFNFFKTIIRDMKTNGWYYLWDLVLIGMRLRKEPKFYMKMTDEEFIKFKYKNKRGKSIDLENPVSFNEKLNWLKLYNRRPEYSIMVNKYLVRQYIADKIGEEHLIPLIGGPWDSVEAIDFAGLPQQFVLKCTHDSGSIVICADKNQFDPKRDCDVLKKGMKKNFYWVGREWPYKNAKPQIIAEKFMVDESGTDLKDYKIFCFNGSPRLIQVDYNRFKGHMRNLYSTQWDFLDVKLTFPSNPDAKIPRPENLETLLAYAEKLSQDIPFVRTDFYVINDQIFFGELTFFPGSGWEFFEPESFEMYMGHLLVLPEIQKRND